MPFLGVAVSLDVLQLPCNLKRAPREGREDPPLTLARRSHWRIYGRELLLAGRAAPGYAPWSASGWVPAQSCDGVLSRCPAPAAVASPRWTPVVPPLWSGVGGPSLILFLVLVLV